MQTLVFLHIGRVEGNIVGCMDKAFREYDPYATVADGSACQTLHVAGCMDQFDVDYNPSATTSDPDACAGVSFHDSLVAEAQSIESMLGVKQMTSALYITEQEAREDLLEQAAAELSSLREELDAMEDQQRDELDAATAASRLSFFIENLCVAPPDLRDLGAGTLNRSRSAGHEADRTRLGR